MQRRPPTPICRTFLVCRAVFQDRHTGEFVLVAPLLRVVSFAFPTVLEMAFFARLTALQGTYRLDLQLQDMEGVTHWQELVDEQLEGPDPLAIVDMDIRGRRIYFPKPGRYEMVFLANGEEVTRYLMIADYPAPPVTP